MPLYAVTIVLYGLAAISLGYLTGGDAEIIDFRNGLPYFGTFNGEYMHQEDGTLFGHSWTLGIEEKFYIIWPLIMVLLWKNRLLAGIALVSCLLVLTWIGRNPELLIRGYAGLSFGAALAVAASQSKGLADWLRSRSAIWMPLAGIAIAYADSLVSPHPYLWNVLISFFAAGLIGSLWLGEKRWLNRALSLPPLAAAGRLTYAIYLTHVLAMNVVVLALSKLNIALPWLALFVICYCASVAVAIVLHRVIEKPMIEAGRNIVKRSAPPVTVPA
ncbi:acyltransferase family protein [Metarhizobium album]|uniref:acyltransferase family protein n=1 Tax=Metarhizobium album TaxID=2182425 RepID=UPI001402C5A4|nr:acyltransferase [Rhizobium album]